MGDVPPCYNADHTWLHAAKNGLYNRVLEHIFHIKQAFPNCKIVGVEPASSPIISRGEKGQHAIQGIGAGFVPKLYQPDLVDSIELVTDEQTMDMFYTLNLKQGYCCGLSSAANIVAAVRLAKDPQNKGKKIVTVFPDGDDRYFTLLAKAPKNK